MLLQCELAEGLRRWTARSRLTQAQASERLGVVAAGAQEAP
jgi:predicted XRE-type DNA-binding protein